MADIPLKNMPTPAKSPHSVREESAKITVEFLVVDSDGAANTNAKVSFDANDPKFSDETRKRLVAIANELLVLSEIV